MLYDSGIAQNMKIGKTKCSYVLVHGIFPHFKDILMKSLQEAPFIVISFDESFNSVAKKGQVDLLIRYWDNDKNRVVTRYFNSEFLGKAAAEDVYETFDLCCSSLDKSKFIQVCSNGQNVNSKFLHILSEKRSDMGLKELIDFGTYGLHTVHRSLQHGVEESEWIIKKLLNALFEIFPFLRHVYLIMKRYVQLQKKITLYVFVPIGGWKTRMLAKEHEKFGLRLLKLSSIGNHFQNLSSQETDN